MYIVHALSPSADQSSFFTDQVIISEALTSIFLMHSTGVSMEFEQFKEVGCPGGELNDEIENKIVAEEEEEEDDDVDNEASVVVNEDMVVGNEVS